MLSDLMKNSDDGFYEQSQAVKRRAGKQDFMHFVHDVLSNLIMNTLILKSDPRQSPDKLVRLTGRHFASQTHYQVEAKNKKHSPKWCRVCAARGIKTATGNPVRSMLQCTDCPGNPGLCLGECFRVYHTNVEYYND